VKRVYIVLAVLGFVLPHFFLLRFLVANGLDFALFFNQIYADSISTFFAVDLAITAVALILIVFRESQRHQMKGWWAHAIATLLVGPSFSFPLFLYDRAGKLEALTSGQLR
jgi:hypothetical protein